MKKRLSWPYFIVLVLDAVGFGIIAPILAPLVKHTHGHFFGVANLFDRHLLFGFILAIFPLSFMLGAPILGALSDRIGRKRVLLICLLGTFGGFIFYLLSFIFSNLYLLMLGRFIAGVTSGSQGVAQAAMVDISQHDDKVVNISFIAVALTIGLVIGPLLGGVLSDQHLISWFNLTTPFYFIIIVCTINVILLMMAIRETAPIKLTKAKLTQPSSHLSSPLKIMLTIFFCFELCWSLYYQSLALLLVKRFDFHSAGIGLFCSYVGLSLAFGLLFLVRWVAKYWSLTKVLNKSLLLLAIATLSVFFAPTLLLQALLAIPVTLAVALAYSSLVTMASDLVADSRQGLLMGSTDGLLALAFSITGLLSGWLAYYNVKLPMLIAAAFGFCAWLIAKLNANHVTSSLRDEYRKNLDFEISEHSPQ